MNHPVTDDDLVDLLKQIHALALSPYPWPANAPPNDDFLMLTLGRIAGMCSAAIDARHRSMDQRQLHETRRNT